MCFQVSESSELSFTGQVGAIQLGISRALQNWEPDFRPPLRACKIKRITVFSVRYDENDIYQSVAFIYIFTDQSFLFYLLCSWFLDARFTCRRKKEARKGESKKELPMGEALGQTCTRMELRHFSSAINRQKVYKQVGSCIVFVM